MYKVPMSLNIFLLSKLAEIVGSLPVTVPVRHLREGQLEIECLKDEICHVCNICVRFRFGVFL